MSDLDFLTGSRELLERITREAYNDQIREPALRVWHKHLRPENPQWRFLTARPFIMDGLDGTAHVLAMMDARLPDLGLVGYFACTNPVAGAAVLEQAAGWLREAHGSRDVYGPINGTITADYRINLSDDFVIPGEPVNPDWHLEAFRAAGFEVFNRYISGELRRYRWFVKALVRRPPAAVAARLDLRPFDARRQLEDLRVYHGLMNAIFPANSIYCPVLSWEERVYNLAGHDPIFDPRYTYFLEDAGRAVGFVVAYSYEGKLIVKTLGLLPEYRGQHLSGLLIHKVHDVAHEDGLTAAVYSTTRVGTVVSKMKRPGVKVHRNYVTMKRHLE
jgi:GNAT superfamily N-acetyltransferase